MKRKKGTNLSFVKMSGAGNDFIIIESLTNLNKRQIVRFLRNKSKKKFVVAVCNRFWGVGADGLLFLKKSNIADVAWEFYNADGSVPEMCGNAARCVVRYCVDKKISGKRVSIQTNFGIIRGEKRSALPKIILSTARIIKQNKEIKIKGRINHGDHIDSGVPHFVTGAKNIFEKKHLYETARRLRRHPSFGRRGTNVTFIEKTARTSFNLISFERGVEDFTLACGTGALAAAASIFIKNSKITLVRIKMPGGRVLVRKTKEGLELSGPAQYICKGEIDSEVLYET